VELGYGTQIEWSVRGGGALRNIDSAHISVPSTPRYQEDRHWLISPFLLFFFCFSRMLSVFQLLRWNLIYTALVLELCLADMFGAL